jgi:plastocyanin
VNISNIADDDVALEKALQTLSVKTAMDKLVEESGGGSVYDCHQQAHHIGRVGYKLFKEKTFQECNASCHSGCYHGAMERFLNEKGTLNLAQNIESICDTFSTHFGNFECLHGVGHGVLAYLDYDLPGAIQECRKLKDEFSQRSCYGGMFMENVLTGQGLGASTKDHETTWINKTDPYFPCNKIDADRNVQEECYLMQTSWMLTINGYDFDKVQDICLKAPSPYRSTCFKSFGRDASGHTLRNPQKIIEICSKVPRTADYYQQCAIGAVNVIIDFWGPNLKNQASELCTLFDEPGKGACVSTLQGRLSQLFHKVILVKEDAFEPSEVTIKQGESVVFYNQAAADRWPASNIHPTHGIYPEFDPKSPVKPGEIWSFTFTKAGSWRFHDHLVPEMKGVIIVE